MEFEGDEIEPFRNFGDNRNHLNPLSDFDKKCQKIYKKTSYSIIRLICLFIFFYLDDYRMTSFIKNIVDFLLIHESLVITNFLLLESILLYDKYLNFNNLEENLNENNNENNNINNNRSFPNVCKYLNSINNM